MARIPEFQRGDFAGFDIYDCNAIVIGVGDIHLVAGHTQAPWFVKLPNPPASVVTARVLGLSTLILLL